MTCSSLSCFVNLLYLLMYFLVHIWLKKCILMAWVQVCYKLFFSYTALENDLFSYAVFIPGIPIAGDNFTITCIVTGPHRLVTTPQLDWGVEINHMPPIPVTEAEADIGFVTIGDMVIDGSANFSRTLSFTKIRTSQARRYTCEVFVSGVISESAFGTLAVQSMSQILLSGNTKYFFFFFF